MSLLNTKRDSVSRGSRLDFGLRLAPRCLGGRVFPEIPVLRRAEQAHQPEGENRRLILAGNGGRRARREAPCKTTRGGPSDGYVFAVTDGLAGRSGFPITPIARSGRRRHPAPRPLDHCSRGLEMRFRP